MSLLPARLGQDNSKTLAAKIKYMIKVVIFPFGSSKITLLVPVNFASVLGP